MSAAQSGQWYWCLDHKRVEPADTACPPGRLMGPYKTQDEAAHWRQKVEARIQAWDQEDRQWEGED